MDSCSGRTAVNSDFSILTLSIECHVHGYQRRQVCCNTNREPFDCGGFLEGFSVVKAQLCAFRALKTWYSAFAVQTICPITSKMI